MCTFEVKCSNVKGRTKLRHKKAHNSRTESNLIQLMFTMCICWCVLQLLLQITCKQESVLLFSDQKTVSSWIDALTKAIL